MRHALSLRSAQRTSPTDRHTHHEPLSLDRRAVGDEVRTDGETVRGAARRSGEVRATEVAERELRRSGGPVARGACGGRTGPMHSLHSHALLFDFMAWGFSDLSFKRLCMK